MNQIQEWMFPNSKKIGFEDVKLAFRHPCIIINTMPIHEQDILIRHTTPHYEEESLINKILEQYEMKKRRIIVYGRNSIDESSEKKAKQLIQLGFNQVYLYVGGLFEWLLLQDIYGEDEFPTTQPAKDLLKYRPLPFT